MKMAKSFTIDPEINQYVDMTKGERSASERVNELLMAAMLREQYEKLEEEAAAFFAEPAAQRVETKGFQKAALHTFSRD
jgi:hypothetical protein